MEETKHPGGAVICLLVNHGLGSSDHDSLFVLNGLWSESATQNHCSTLAAAVLHDRSMDKDQQCCSCSIAYPSGLTLTQPVSGVEGPVTCQCTYAAGMQTDVLADVADLHAYAMQSRRV